MYYIIYCYNISPFQPDRSFLCLCVADVYHQMVVVSCLFLKPLFTDLFPGGLKFDLGH